MARQTPEARLAIGLRPSASPTQGIGGPVRVAQGDLGNPLYDFAPLSQTAANLISIHENKKDLRETQRAQQDFLKITQEEDPLAALGEKFSKFYQDNPGADPVKAGTYWRATSEMAAGLIANEARDSIEARVEEWMRTRDRTDDPSQIKEIDRIINEELTEFGQHKAITLAFGQEAFQQEAENIRRTLGEQLESKVSTAIQREGRQMFEQYVGGEVRKLIYAENISDEQWKSLGNLVTTYGRHGVAPRDAGPLAIATIIQAAEQAADEGSYAESIAFLRKFRDKIGGLNLGNRVTFDGEETTPRSAIIRTMDTIEDDWENEQERAKRQDATRYSDLKRSAEEWAVQVYEEARREGLQSRQIATYGDNALYPEVGPSPVPEADRGEYTRALRGIISQADSQSQLTEDKEARSKIFEMVLNDEYDLAFETLQANKERLDTDTYIKLFELTKDGRDTFSEVRNFPGYDEDISTLSGIVQVRGLSDTANDAGLTFRRGLLKKYRDGLQGIVGGEGTLQEKQDRRRVLVESLESEAQAYQDKRTAGKAQFDAKLIDSIRVGENAKVAIQEAFDAGFLDERDVAIAVTKSNEAVALRNDSLSATIKAFNEKDLLEVIGDVDAGVPPEVQEAAEKALRSAWPDAWKQDTRRDDAIDEAREAAKQAATEAWKQFQDTQTSNALRSFIPEADDASLAAVLLVDPENSLPNQAALLKKRFAHPWWRSDQSRPTEADLNSYYSRVLNNKNPENIVKAFSRFGMRANWLTTGTIKFQGPTGELLQADIVPEDVDIWKTPIDWRNDQSYVEVPFRVHTLGRAERGGRQRQIPKENVFKAFDQAIRDGRADKLFSLWGDDQEERDAWIVTQFRLLKLAYPEHAR